MKLGLIDTCGVHSELLSKFFFCWLLTKQYNQAPVWAAMLAELEDEQSRR